MANSITADEKKWRAESDARTLMEATEIQNKKGRLTAALREVKNIQKEAERTAKKAGNLTKKKPAKRKATPKKRTRKKK